MVAAEPSVGGFQHSESWAIVCPQSLDQPAAYLSSYGASFHIATSMLFVLFPGPGVAAIFCSFFASSINQLKILYTEFIC